MCVDKGKNMQIYMCKCHLRFTGKLKVQTTTNICICQHKNTGLQRYDLKHAIVGSTGYREGIGFAGGLVSGRRFRARFAGTIDVGAVNVVLSAGRNDS